MWVHIGAWWYDFEQKQRDAELVKAITKPALLSFFDKYFFHTPTNLIRRLSIHVTSQRLLPPQLGQLIPHLQALEIPIDPEQFGQFGNSRPTVDQAKEFAEQVLKANGKSEEEVEKLKGVIEELREWPVPEGYELIGDREQWRKERERAPPAHPVEEVRLCFPFSFDLTSLLTLFSPHLQFAHLVPAELRHKL
jgi:insulysin